MSLLGGFGGQNSGDYNSGSSVPTGQGTLKYARNARGEYITGADGRYAIDDGEGGYTWTGKRPAYGEDITPRFTGTAPTGRVPDADGMVTVDGRRRPYDPMVDDPRNAPTGQYREQNWLDGVLAPVANALGGSIPTITGGVGVGPGAPVGPFWGKDRPLAPNPNLEKGIDASIANQVATQNTNNPTHITLPPQNNPAFPSGGAQGPSQIDTRNLGSSNPSSSTGTSTVNLTTPRFSAADYSSAWGKLSPSLAATLRSQGLDPITREPVASAADAAAGAGTFVASAANVLGAAANLAPIVTGVIDGVNRMNGGGDLAKAEGEAAGILSEAASGNAARATTEFNTQRALDDKIYNQNRTDTQSYRAQGEGALSQLGQFDYSNPYATPADFGMAQMQTDPGYAFRIKEGMNALENSASARGGLLGGNTLKAITKYGQDMGSQEYGNAFNRYTTQNQNKFNNYQTVNNSRFSGLNALAGMGQNAVGQAQQGGQNYVNNSTQTGQNYVNNVGQYNNQDAAARAVGKTSAAAANVSGYQGGLNSILGGFVTASNMYNQNAMMDKWMKMQGGKS